MASRSAEMFTGVEKLLLHCEKLAIEFVSIVEPKGYIKRACKRDDFSTYGESKIRFLDKTDAHMSEFVASSPPESGAAPSDDKSLQTKAASACATWPAVDCLVLMREAPWSVSKSTDESVPKTRVFGEMLEAVISMGTGHPYVGAFGKDVVPPEMLASAELYEVWGFKTCHLESCLDQFSHTKQRSGQ
eukprot:GHVU01154905.1.p1 GENE.GHVU01154905.1~~GHVU01154905.1.p1  ORF type:complete len:188 (+),score=20.17 GHVU01154905.1:318-881(+)